MIGCSAAMSRFVVAQPVVSGRGPCCSSLNCLGCPAYAAAILNTSAGAEILALTCHAPILQGNAACGMTFAYHDNAVGSQQQTDV